MSVAVEDALRAWQRPQHSVAASPRESAESRPAPVSALPSELTENPQLSDYIRAALERNPDVRAAAANVEARLARIPQVTSLPDPLVRALVRPEPVQTAVGDVFFTLGVSQMIPTPAKLDRAGRAAAAEVRMAIAQLNAARVRVIADVEHAYYALYLAERLTELTATSRALLEDLERVVSLRYEVGQVHQQDVLRVQMAITQTQDDEHAYKLRRASAAAALNRVLNRAVTDHVAPVSSLHSAAWPADTDELLQLAETRNPELARLTQQIARDREKWELAKLGYWPDVTVGIEWNYLKGRTAFRPPPNAQTGITPPYNRASEGGDDNWALMVQMNVPLWMRRIEGAKREARQDLLKTEHALESARAAVAFRIYDAWARVEAQRHTVDLLSGTLIPQARQTYDITVAAYQGGDTDFLSVIDSWRRWLDFELMLHRETVDLQTAFSELQREVGVQLVEQSTALGSAVDSATPAAADSEE